MIDDIYTSSRWLQVTNPGGRPYISPGTSGVGVGNVRFNAANSNLEVYDGYNWISFNSGSTSIMTTPQADATLTWAEQKMVEEQRWDALAKESPTVKDLLNQIEEKKAQLRVVEQLMQKEVTVAA